MIVFESKYFQKFKYTKFQLKQYYDNALKDQNIASKNDDPNVIYRFCYDAIVKLGIAVIAAQGYKVRSVRGHHIKILEVTELQLFIRRNIVVVVEEFGYFSE